MRGLELIIHTSYVLLFEMPGKSILINVGASADGSSGPEHPPWTSFLFLHPSTYTTQDVARPSGWPW